MLIAEASKDTQLIASKLPALILLYLLDELPPQRSGDYRKLLMKPPKKADRNTSNFFNLTLRDTTGSVVFHTSKGSTKRQVKHRGSSGAHELPDYLVSMVQMLRKLDSKRVYLIEHKRRPMMDSQFSKFIQRTYGLTMNNIRKLYVQKEVDSKAIQKAEKVAKDMGNSVRIQQQDYASRD